MKNWLLIYIPAILFWLGFIWGFIGSFLGYDF